MRTSWYIADAALYIGAWLFDEDPAGIVVGQTLRDASLNDSDAFVVVSTPIWTGRTASSSARHRRASSTTARSSARVWAVARAVVASNAARRAGST